MCSANDTVVVVAWVRVEPRIGSGPRPETCAKFSGSCAEPGFFVHSLDASRERATVDKGSCGATVCEDQIASTRAERLCFHAEVKEPVELACVDALARSNDV